jgi:hypothetical protein
MPKAVTGNSVWYGWSIARAAATFSDGSGGVVLDGWGGVHPFAVSPNPQPAAATMSGYWYGWDIARSLVLLPGSTASSYQGYVLDGWGGLHPFAGGAASLPPTPSTDAYWQGWDIVGSVVMVLGSTTDGYVVDDYGGYHPFGSAPAVVTPNYAANGWLVHGATAA